MKNHRFVSYFVRPAILFVLVAATGLSAFAQREYLIAAIQGDKNVSPHERSHVRVSGIVTARTRTGFFIQTPDDKIDDNPATSEGIFIYTRDEPGGDAVIGNLISVTGTVTEFRPRAEPNSLSITEISVQKGRDTIRVISAANPLPKPIVLTVDDFKANTIDQLERFEGMRVTVSEMTVVAPTGGRVDNRNNRAESNGVFYGVVKGLQTVFREPGYAVYDYLFMSDKERNEFKKKYPKMRLFDWNPERLRIESNAQLGSQAINVAAHTELKNVTGVVHYAFRCYSILTDVDTRPTISGALPPVNMPAAGPEQFTVATMNLENFFDDEDDPNIKEDIVTTMAFTQRKHKISAAIRGIMQTPDVIGVVEIEGQPGLKRLADRINADAEAAGKPNPKYEAYVVGRGDGRGINVGYLVRADRVKVLETKQLGAADRYKNPNTNQENNLNDRPPLMLRASINDPKAGKPIEITVLVNHLKSFLGYNDPKQMNNVRMKKRLQAEFLAKFAGERIKANPDEKILIVGDFNAYHFNDGIVDVIGTIKGTPAAADEVLNPSPDLVDPDMINLVDLINPDQRYSYRFDGNGQVLDTIIISQSLRPYVHGYGYARVNADFPQIFRNEDRPERFSDHDPAVAYFNLVPRAAAAASRPQ